MLRANSSCCPVRPWSVVLAAVLLFSAAMMAQRTISTGSIVGTVTDPSGAVVSGAKVTITNTGTGRPSTRQATPLVRSAVLRVSRELQSAGFGQGL